MDRDHLEQRLADGMSLAAIGREDGLHASTVSYWVEKHALKLGPTSRHVARGGVPEDVLRDLVAQGYSTREIAERIERSQFTTRRWLTKYGLQTVHTRGRPHNDPLERVPKQRYVGGKCPRHGQTRFAHQGKRIICTRCRSEAVTDWRRRVKRMLIEEAGGCCRECGYDRCASALHFHHLDPATKRFSVAARGMTRSMDSVRAEAAKCVLLCANCHAEVEAGIRVLALRSPGAPAIQG